MHSGQTRDPRALPLPLRPQKEMGFPRGCQVKGHCAFLEHHMGSLLWVTLLWQKGWTR